MASLRTMSVGSWLLVAACGGDDAAQDGGGTEPSSAGADPSVGTTISTSVSDSLTESGDVSGTPDSTAGSESVDDSSTGEPPAMPDCDGQEPAVDELGTTPGDASSPSPTIEHLSVEWLVDGDTDLDGVVTVRWRETGRSEERRVGKECRSRWWPEQ